LSFRPLTGYSTKMPFTLGEHRELSEIDERDIMAVALDLDVALSDMDTAIERVIEGLSSADVSRYGECDSQVVADILENAAPRISILERFLEG